jgi:hypothetical protein
MARSKPSAEPLAYIAVDLRPLAVPLGDVLLDPRNSRAHPESSIVAIAASLERFGQRTPIVAVRGTRIIIKGNGTHQAAVRLGWTHIAVSWVDDDDATARAYSLADNRSQELSGWNDAELAEAIKALSASDEALTEALSLELLASQRDLFAIADGVDPKAPGEVPEAISEESQKLKEFIERRKASVARGNDKAEVNFWVCLVFQSWLQKMEFLSKIADVPVLYGMYANGEVLAAKVGLPVTPNAQKVIESPLDKKLTALVLLTKDPDLVTS